MARLDQLNQAKEVAQLGSVMGREFSYDMLQAVSSQDEETIQDSLAQLVEAELLYQRGRPPRATYTFKHALIQDAAYASMLRRTRQQVHQAMAQVLETQFAETIETHPELIAHHYTEARMLEQAVGYWRQAGQQAYQRSAYREAVAHFTQAIEVLEHLPKERAILEQGIDLHYNLSRAYLPAADMPRVLEHLRAAEALAETLGDQRRLASILAWLTQFLRATGDHDRALEAGQRAVALAADFGDLTLQFEADYWLANVYQSMGDYARALECYRRSVESIPADRLYERFALGGLPAVQCRTSIVQCLVEQGEFAEAKTYSDEALRIAEHVDHTISLLHVYSKAGNLALHQGDPFPAIPVLERGFELCQRRQVRAFITRFLSALGAAYTLSGRVAEAIPLLEQSAEDGLAMGWLAYYPQSLIHLSEAYLRTGRIEDATDVAGRALDYCCDHKKRGDEVGALRALGDIAMHHNPPEIDNAETHYQQALTLADELDMRPLQAHCHRGLGTLYNQTGQVEQARTELSTAIEMYRDMEMTFWLPETEAALAEVEER